MKFTIEILSKSVTKFEALLTLLLYIEKR